MRAITSLYLALTTILLAFSAQAQSASDDQVDALWAAMKVDEFVQLLAQEGQDDAAEMEATMFPGEGGGEWRAEMARIYDAPAMGRRFRDAFKTALGGKDISGAVDFFNSPTGRTAIDLELAARRALLDPAVEDLSVQTLYDRIAEDHPRLDLIREYSDVNGLVDFNVAGTLNGNYAFLSTLADEGQGPFADDPSLILGEVWSQEADIQAETEEWVMAYFNFAYSPLSDDEVRELIDFSRTPSGRRLNTSMFAAFDELFDEIARDLARTAASFMRGERL